MLSRMEVFSNIESEIERAVQLDQDALIQSLDKEIAPILEEILRHRATNTTELMKQLKFITDLLVRRSDDAATVVRLSAKLSEMITYYFQEERVQLREDHATMGIASLPELNLAQAEDSQPTIARVAVISTDYRFLYCNSVMADDLCSTPRQLVGRPVGEFCNEAIFEESYRAHLDMALAGDFREFEAPSLANCEDCPTYHVRLTPLRNIERRITGAVMVAQVGGQGTAEADGGHVSIELSR